MKTKFFFTTLIVAVLAMALAACGSAQTPVSEMDPISVVKAFHTAVIAKDLDTAMPLVADEAVFVVGGPRGGTKTGQAEIRAWFQDEAAVGITFEYSNYQVDGDTVTYDRKVFLSGLPRGGGSDKVVVQNSKITSWGPNATDPAAIITAIHEKMNAGDVDRAMALIADNAVFYNAPGQAGGAKLDTRDAIRAWIQRQVDANTMAELSDIQVNGDAATWHAKVTRGSAVLVNGPAGGGKFKDGKLIEWTFK